MSHPIGHELRQALLELRIAYHQALARRLGREIPSADTLRSLINDESDEAQVLVRMARRRWPFWRGRSVPGPVTAPAAKPPDQPSSLRRVLASLTWWR